MGNNDGETRDILIEDVSVGMVVRDVFGPDGRLLMSSGVSVSAEQINLLRQRGVKSVHVRFEGDNSVPGNAVENTEILSREKSYYQELSRAKVVHQKSLQTVREALSTVRMGKKINFDELELVAEGMVESVHNNPDALVSLAQIKGYDEYTFVHSVNVGILLTSLAYSIGYSKDKLRQAGVGGMLHDIGKMWVPEQILNKRGKYNDYEMAIMKRHSQYGIDILKKSTAISDFSKLVVIQHHERYDGRGYPHGLIGDQIDEVGLMAAVADVYDAMTTDRVYREAWTPQRALAMIFQGAESEYSRRIVELFTKHLGIYPVGSFVRLVSGEMGVVVRVDKGGILAPDVLILFERGGKRLREPVEYKLLKMQKEANGKLFRIELSLNPKSYNVDIGMYVKTNPFE
jgi:putative nucleotidyltransferase with HDIG domain